MKRILTIALAALTLSGCMANWKSPRTGPRFSDGPGLGESYDSTRVPPNAPPLPPPVAP
jgi:hypothetical protein